MTPAGNPSAYANYITAWAAPTNSLYLSPDQDDGGIYQGEFYTVDYQTTFDLTGLDPASTVITGEWSTDNHGFDILINGHSTGLTSPGYGAFTPFDLSPFQGDFQAGVNTLDFVWNNDNGFGGMDVQNLQGTALPAAVPEASTTVSLGLLLALGMGGVMVAARRKKASAGL